MDVYQDYWAYFYCSSEYFIWVLEKRLQSLRGWYRRRDLEANFKKNSMQEKAEVFCLEAPTTHFRDREIQGVLWIWTYSNRIEVFNITPLLRSHLSPAEYNYILKCFDVQIIGKLGEDIQIEVHMSKPFFDMGDIIGYEGLNALEYFSRTSNRSNGHSHPSDFKKWSHFVFIVYRQKRKLSADRLKGWLIEDGWSDRMASSLSRDFEYSIALLEEYENY